MNKGFVSLVGAGPGDADLMTVKALRRLQEADVVVYDRLVSAEILNLIPQGISRISVGKAAGNHCVPQDEINQTLLVLAQTGRRVVRLKGGDPYIFGRGGEEALVLKKHHIDFEIVPGVTAASGCGAYAGIPLTHRGTSHSVRFITGHFHNDEALDINWDKLVDPDCTLVIYMGLSNLQKISDELVKAGLASTTPAAAVHGATTQKQAKVIATLSELPNAVVDAGLKSPVIIIVGEVVALNHRLDWFQSQCEASEKEVEYDSFDMVSTVSY
ncbi:MAG: uroporphyrinogen-III C-methyltransferase [Gammaproteobacteria bacterium]|nr:uroporphyrinogen-III C-methyltransferase [Gammaproteobacteria bacterium]